MWTEKSCFTCLVKASSHIAGDFLLTMAQQVDKAEFVCAGRRGHGLSKIQTRAIYALYSSWMGLLGACCQIIADATLYSKAHEFVISITTTFMAAFTSLHC